jgi:hypothetical protein
MYDTMIMQNLQLFSLHKSVNRNLPMRKQRGEAARNKDRQYMNRSQQFQETNPCHCSRSRPVDCLPMRPLRRLSIESNSDNDSEVSSLSSKGTLSSNETRSRIALDLPPKYPLRTVSNAKSEFSFASLATISRLMEMKHKKCDLLSHPHKCQFVKFETLLAAKSLDRIIMKDNQRESAIIGMEIDTLGARAA